MRGWNPRYCHRWQRRNLRHQIGHDDLLGHWSLSLGLRRVELREDGAAIVRIPGARLKTVSSGWTWTWLAIGPTAFQLRLSVDDQERERTRRVWPEFDAWVWRYDLGRFDGRVMETISTTESLGTPIRQIAWWRRQSPPRTSRR
jgi:hypothetical protein